MCREADSNVDSAPAKKLKLDPEASAAVSCQTHIPSIILF